MISYGAFSRGTILPGEFGFPTQNFRITKTLNDGTEWIGEPTWQKIFRLGKSVSQKKTWPDRLVPLDPAQRLWSTDPRWWTWPGRADSTDLTHSSIINNPVRSVWSDSTDTKTWLDRNKRFDLDQRFDLTMANRPIFCNRLIELSVQCGLTQRSLTAWTKQTALPGSTNLIEWADHRDLL